MPQRKMSQRECTYEWCARDVPLIAVHIDVFMGLDKTGSITRS